MNPSSGKRGVQLEEIRLFYSDGTFEQLTPTEAINRFAKTIIKSVESMTSVKTK